MHEPSAMLERALRRDAAYVAAGNEPDPRTTSEIADIVLKHELYDSDASRRWLVDRAPMPYISIRERLIETIPPLLERGYASDAIDILSAVLALGSDDGRPSESREVLRVPSGIRHEVERVLATPGLISQHVGTLGKHLARVLSGLLAAEHKVQVEQYDGMSRSSSDYHLCHRYFQTEHGKYEAWRVLPQAMERSLLEAVHMPDVGAFGTLADELIAREWALGVCLPLVALHDCEEVRVNSSWQYHEAVRLLCLAEVAASAGARQWRRLIRRQLRPSLTSDDQYAVVKAIRAFQEDQRNLVAELSDFDDCGILTEDEETDIDAARAECELGEPYDPRELRRELRRREHPEQSIEDRWLAKWPHAEDHNALTILADAERHLENADIGDVEESLFPRLDALNSIADRPEIDLPDWRGAILGWCESAAEDMKRWHRLKHDMAKRAEIPVEQYIELLDGRAPWWEGRVSAALGILRSTLPKEHRDQESDFISWSGNDPIACSLGYLDELLAAGEGSRIDEYRSSFQKTLVAVWESWPGYTRGLAIAIVRPYHWAMSDDLTRLLAHVLHSETNSHQIGMAFDHLLCLGRPGIADLMQSLIGRVDTLSEPSETGHLIGDVIGDAVIRYRAEGEDMEELADISEWFERLKTECRSGSAVRNDLVVSILQSATTRVKSLEFLTRVHAEVWLGVVEWGLNNWLGSGDERNDDLPILPLSSMREMRWERDEYQFLLQGLLDVVVHVVQEAEVGAFYEVHYELRKLLEDEPEEVDVVLDRATMRLLTPWLLDLCRASAERVAGWAKEGRTTNDLAYVFSLNGDNTSDLIMHVFDTAIDRENARRELAPVIDILADAGLRDLAAALRQKVRHV